jgi:hypothetical protein
LNSAGCRRNRQRAQTADPAAFYGLHARSYTAAMLRNYLAAALRNFARNKLYAAINVVGLSVGFATALLIALFVHHETTF